MDATDWYETTQGGSLLQGDLLLNCPVFTLDADLPFPLPDPFEPVLLGRVFNLIVLTHSCDLTNDKICEILCAQVVEWQAAVRTGAASNPTIRSKDFRRALVAGNIPSLSLLHKRDDFPALPWSVVNFH